MSRVKNVNTSPTEESLINWPKRFVILSEKEAILTFVPHLIGRIHLPDYVRGTMRLTLTFESTTDCLPRSDPNPPSDQCHSSSNKRRNTVLGEVKMRQGDWHRIQVVHLTLERKGKWLTKEETIEQKCGGDLLDAKRQSVIHPLPQHRLGRPMLHRFWLDPRLWNAGFNKCCHNELHHHQLQCTVYSSITTRRLWRCEYSESTVGYRGLRRRSKWIHDNGPDQHTLISLKAVPSLGLGVEWATGILIPDLCRLIIAFLLRDDDDQDQDHGP